MTREQRDSCEKLVHRLEKMDNAQCDMAHWVYNRSKFDHKYFSLPPAENRGIPGCGTTACLAGWAVALLAPSVMVNHSVVSLPTVWADLREIPCCTTYDDLDLGDYGMYEIEHVGKALLGDKAHALFLCVNGPLKAGMTDREWMIDHLYQIIRRFDTGFYDMPKLAE